MISNKDILFASLLGSKVAEAIPRLTNVQNELMKHVLPPIPFLPLQNEVNVAEPDSDILNPSRNRERQASNLALEAREWRADFQKTEQQQYFPLSFAFTPDGQKYLLPYEPFITIKGSNKIVKREVAKANNLRGTIKERWNAGDFEINITGVLIGAVETGRYEECFPREDFKLLFDYLVHAGPIWVFSRPLLNMGITKVVVEEYTFPFTKGENVQAYDLKCTSDDNYSLLVPLKQGEPGVEFTDRLTPAALNNTGNLIQG
ncbi:MAG: hypothetical protein KKC03_06130 [Bacteroidetes bacterium]|nr:hypothetical protein [Bacteroidota bacterium]